MPVDRNKPAVIIDNLENFINKLFCLISANTAESSNKLVSCIQKAGTKYKEPLNSWVRGLLYTFYRTRGAEVNSAMNGIKGYANVATRLIELNTMLKHGKWNTTSFNHYLLIELYALVPGYAPAKDALTLKAIIDSGKVLLFKKIDDFLINDALEQQAKIKQEALLLASRQEMQKRHAAVVILNQLDGLKALASKHQDKTHFCLLFNKSWTLSWVDFLGHEHKLELTQELAAFLKNAKIKVGDLPKLFRNEKVINECLNAHQAYLDKVKIQINPAADNDSLVKQKIAATFVIRGESKNYSLYWISTINRVNKISLDAYPQFKAWLNAQPILDDKKVVLQLKAYLSMVDTRIAFVDKDNVREKLMVRYAAPQDPKAPLKSELVKPSLKAVPAPRPLDLRLFKRVAECLGERVDANTVESPVAVKAK